MQHYPANETLAEAVAKSFKVARVTPREGGRSLHFNGDELAEPSLGHDVHFMAPLVLAQVKQPMAQSGNRSLRAQLAGDEGSKKPAKQVRVPRQPLKIGADNGRKEAAIADEALWSA